jgi:hypothetical protein
LILFTLSGIALVAPLSSSYEMLYLISVHHPNIPNPNTNFRQEKIIKIATFSSRTGWCFNKLNQYSKMLCSKEWTRLVFGLQLYIMVFDGFLNASLLAWVVS